MKEVIKCETFRTERISDKPFVRNSFHPNFFRPNIFALNVPRKINIRWFYVVCLIPSFNYNQSLFDSFVLSANTLVFVIK